MRLLGVLFLPAVLAFAVTYSATRLVAAPQSEPERVTSIVWGGLVFENQRDFARWLRARGVNYQAWARRHPAALGRHARTPPRRAAAARALESDGSRWNVVAIGGAVSVLFGGLLLSTRLRRVRRVRRSPRPAAVRRSAPVWQLPAMRLRPRVTIALRTVARFVGMRARLLFRAGGTALTSSGRVLRTVRQLPPMRLRPRVTIALSTVARFFGMRARLLFRVGGTALTSSGRVLRTVRQLPAMRLRPRVTIALSTVARFFGMKARLLFRVGGTALTSSGRVLRTVRVAYQDHSELQWYLTGLVLLVAVCTLVAARA
jgi:hypothetical protein